VHPKTEQIPLEQFVLSFQDSMDTEDDSSKILPILEKHTAVLTAAKAESKPEAAEEKADAGGEGEAKDSKDS
jgi:hypothetical protein